MTFLTCLFQMFALLIMIGAGALAAHLNWLDEHTDAKISKMIVNLFNPLLALSGAANAVGKISLDTLGLVFFVAVCMFTSFIVISLLTARFFDKDAVQQRICKLMIVFPNCGFIGIPVVSSLLGQEYVVYVSIFVLVYNLYFYTYGVSVLDGKFSLQSLKALNNPGTYCCVLGVLLIIFSVNLPEFLLTAVNSIGDCASPLALMTVGSSLYHADLKQIFRQPRLYVFSALKLLILPLLALPLLRLLPLESDLLALVMIMFGMPVGNMPLILAAERNMDCSVCSASIMMTTALCVVTIPILVTLI